jgi:hypothetical protein
MAMEFEINLDNKEQLHDDLEKIRENRERLGEKGEAEIVLKWTKEDESKHELSVHVKTSNLWVTGCKGQLGKEIEFKEEIRNYMEKDEGTTIYIKGITNLLEELENGRYNNFEKTGSRERNAYLMCVFVASEIVRNELLEKVLIKSFSNKNYATWKTYRRVYSNFASVSKALYKYYPTIRVEDVGKNIGNGSIFDNSNLQKDYQKLLI